jgi:probable HAF family extracellular repeat protein
MMLILVAVCWALPAVASQAVAEPKFMGLGDLDGALFFSEAFGVSGDGSTIVGRSDSTLGSEAFVWTEGSGIVGLGDLAGGAFNSGAIAASQDGSVIVGYATSESGNENFRWTDTTNMVGLGTAPFTFTGGVSNDGSVVVGTFADSLSFDRRLRRRSSVRLTACRRMESISLEAHETTMTKTSRFGGTRRPR